MTKPIAWAALSREQGTISRMPSTRREFLQQSIVAPMGAAGVAAQPAPATSAARAASTVRKPKRLRPGQTVGIVDPASATWDPVDVDIVVESLAALGLKAKLGAHLMDRRGYLAGRDEDRAADVMAMFTDPDVAAVHALRGGWGCARVLPHLDFDAIARNPKILLGYSDITALLLPVFAKGGFVTFHGMNGASEWNRFNVDWFRRVLMQGEAVTMTNPMQAGNQLVPTENRDPDDHARPRARPDHRRQPHGADDNHRLRAAARLRGRDPVRGGRAGGALPHRSDVHADEAGRHPRPGEGGDLRALYQVLAGRRQLGSLTIGDVLDDYLTPLKVPAWEGAQIGHIDRQFIMPIGVPAEVDAREGDGPPARTGGPVGVDLSLDARCVASTVRRHASGVRRPSRESLGPARRAHRVERLGDDAVVTGGQRFLFAPSWDDGGEERDGHRRSTAGSAMN